MATRTVFSAAQTAISQIQLRQLTRLINCILLVTCSDVIMASHNKLFVFKEFYYQQSLQLKPITSLFGHSTVNSLLPRKQLSSTPIQGTVTLQVPARLSLELAHAGHTLPFGKGLGTGDMQEKKLRGRAKIPWLHFP